jgi:hypothetical protein
VHSSVMLLGEEYKPRARFPIGMQLRDIQEFDPFERARSIIGLLVSADGLASPTSDRNSEMLNSLSTELLDCIDNSMYII